MLDAAKVPYLKDRLDDAGLRNRCLFKGESEAALRDIAPYLVELQKANGFTRRLFTLSDKPADLWSLEPGIYLRSNAEFDTIWRHLRRFTHVQDEHGNWMYFRF